MVFVGYVRNPLIMDVKLMLIIVMLLEQSVLFSTLNVTVYCHVLMMILIRSRKRFYIWILTVPVANPCVDVCPHNKERYRTRRMLQEAIGGEGPRVVDPEENLQLAKITA